MRLVTFLSALVLSSASVCFAFAPVANLSSNQTVLLDGHSLGTAGVSSWPLVLGDDVTTAAAPATLSFSDGSRVVLGPQSRARITGTTAQPRIILLAGKLDYKLSPISEITLAQDPNQNPSTDVNGPQPAITGAQPPTQEKHPRRGFFLIGSLVAAAAVASAFAAFVLINPSSVSQL